MNIIAMIMCMAVILSPGNAWQCLSDVRVGLLIIREGKKCEALGAVQRTGYWLYKNYLYLYNWNFSVGLCVLLCTVTLYRRICSQ